jgi:hypothetical protein
MEDPKMQETFTSCYFRDVDWAKYDEVSLTGGEPLLDVPRTARIIGAIRTLNPYCKIWLYTNGTKLDRKVAGLFKTMGLSGITVSLHTELDRMELAVIHCMIMPLRFLSNAEEFERTDEFGNGWEYYCKDYTVPYRIWRMDDCYDMEPEDRFLLKR